MQDNVVASLDRGESVAEGNGERFGRSRDGGHLVQLRRRKAGAGFVVTTDAPAKPESPTVVMTAEWGAANIAFDRLLKDY